MTRDWARTIERSIGAGILMLGISFVLPIHALPLWKLVGFAACIGIAIPIIWPEGRKAPQA